MHLIIESQIRIANCQILICSIPCKPFRSFHLTVLSNEHVFCAWKRRESALANRSNTWMKQSMQRRSRRVEEKREERAPLERENMEIGKINCCLCSHKFIHYIIYDRRETVKGEGERVRGADDKESPVLYASTYLFVHEKTMNLRRDTRIHVTTPSWCKPIFLEAVFRFPSSHVLVPLPPSILRLFCYLWGCGRRDYYTTQRILASTLYRARIYSAYHLHRMAI